ncbi:MAG: metal-dependent hydrolase [Flavobacteriales bacterium]|nr:metal-dependent hydrolase [Flavobacteriales bacterium]
MDSLTQAVLGAAIGEAILGQRLGAKAAITGAILATIPDLDVILVPFYDELQKISIHRGYSHSILFSLIMASVAAFVLSKFKWAKAIPIPKLWLFSWLAFFTHIILDAFTSYGTQLFLPFTDWRVSFDSINIIDPVYTLPLLLGVLGSTVIFKKENKKRGIINKIGLIISSIYLIFTLGNKQNIEQIFQSQLEEKNLPYFRLLTVPVKVGSINWYGVARDGENLHIGKYSLWDDDEIIFHTFPINESLLKGLDEELVDRMKWFSQGFYTVAESEGKIRIYNMQCDMQGIREFGEYKAPTAFYFEIDPHNDGSFDLSSGMHP